MLTYCFARRDEQTAPNCVKAAFRKTSLITVTDIHRDHCLVKEQSSAQATVNILDLEFLLSSPSKCILTKHNLVEKTS
ncbi:hypothetical protein HAX54_021785 [Datura stramonium]|uniref:Uncharacterized protein n=1 Tax=Datura stramonium TaxID=4076 RepID=A0ABS8UVP1_DATST|nr:hypothetical protein [Datura stramonium]